MTNITQKILAAQKRAMALSPTIGGFPVLAEVLRQSGIKINRWSLPSCQSIYLTEDGAVVQQGTPLINDTQEIPKFNCDQLIMAIRKDQQGQSTFPEFLQAIWNAGVIGYDVDFLARNVNYYGVNGESYLEEYPAVEITK